MSALPDHLINYRDNKILLHPACLSTADLPFFPGMHRL